MSNLDLYNKVRSVPEDAKKEIQGGRLKGYTNINAMWRIRTLTENFGICGMGWKYKVVKQWVEEGGNNEKSAFVDIELFIKIDGEWSEAIPGSGGSSFVTREIKGLYTDDECYKKATTDALSVACKMIGIGADVYWVEDSDKYSPSSENKNVSDINIEVLAKVKRILYYAAGKDQNKALELLEKHTSFVGREGKTIAGLKSFDKLQGKRLTATYGELQKAYPDIAKTIKAKEKKAG